MAINKWRYAGYDSDGVTEYQCLQCGMTWGMRGRPGPFCSYCGTKWESELVWNTPEREDQEYKISDAIYAKRPKRSAFWIVQVRVLWLEEKTGLFKPMAYEETDGWHDDCPSLLWDVETYSARSMHATLLDKRRWARNDSFTRIEYRVIRKEQDPSSAAS